ncbi:endonuclease domain-containing protein [Asticcacaulis sp. AND118]|uniref:endonuclease domain-containing protein n=1 Tax=Asticcacaulis sp. AND118 TaxID=2840468 RepID=UPI001CFFF466|nr:endonuclease domain-containing protein [Asticcacaulis sp. AND118]UDF03796.1 endonuclease domain-containing protein [Asticcacaulis sp. AND118]
MARKLRKAQNLSEWLIWERLKDRKSLGAIFRRQHAIGPYILDFYCFKAQLCIEIDGTLHGEETQRAKDMQRDQWLQSQGLTVYRITAAEVLRDADAAADGIIQLALARIAQN